MEREGYLARDKTNLRYEIGLKILAIARGALRQVDSRKTVDPVLERLAQDTGLDVIICVLEQEQVLVVNRIVSPDFLNSDVGTGTEFPAHATSAGKVLLAHLPPAELLTLLDTNALVKNTPKTLVGREDLLTNLDSIRQQGYADCFEEFELGLRSIAVPIVDSGRSVWAALSTIGSTQDDAWQDLPALVNILKVSAREISHSMHAVSLDRFTRRLGE